MNSQKKGRIAEQIRWIIAQSLLREGPRSDRGGWRVSFERVVISGCDLSKDSRQCRVRVRWLDLDVSAGQKKAVLDALQGYRGVLQKNIAKQLQLKHTPELAFVWDEGVDHQAHIEALLDQIKSG